MNRGIWWYTTRVAHRLLLRQINWEEAGALPFSIQNDVPGYLNANYRLVLSHILTPL